MDKYPDLEKAYNRAIKMADCCNGRQEVIQKYKRKVAVRDKRQKKR